MSSRQIVKTLRDQDQTVSQSTVIRLLGKNALEHEKTQVEEKSALPRGRKKLRTPAMIAKVKRAVTGPNPATQNQLAKKHQVSQSTIHRIIHQDLGGVLRKKHRVHALSNRQIQQRLDRGPGFLKRISGQKWKFFLTVDEAWVYLTNVNGRRKLYYELRGGRTDESWTKLWTVSHPIGVMFFAGISSRGVTKLRFIEPGAKINSDYYIEHCLKPLFEDDIPRLFPGEEHKVVFHQDSAPAHASKKTQKWLADSGINFIPAAEWMGNSPDMAPMDFSINGIFKWKLFDKAASSILGLKRVMTTVWSGLSRELCVKTLKSWPKRVKMMILSGGLHVEHKLNGGK